MNPINALKYSCKMTNLNEWVEKNARRPLVRLVAVSLGALLLYFSFLIYTRYAEQMARIELAKESISLGIQQSNRPLIEAAMMSLLSDPGISAIALCIGDRVEMSYPPEHSTCGKKPISLRSWNIRRSVVGVAGREISISLAPLSAFGPLLFLITLAVLTLTGIITVISGISGRLRAEIISPLADGFNDDSPLLISELETVRLNNLERMELIRTQAAANALIQISAQVAHDIKSPLAALGVAAKGLESLPPEQRSLIDGAVNRMQGIADDLLQRYRAPSAASAISKLMVCPLGGIIEQVLAEKRLQHKEKTGVTIEFAGASNEINALVEPKELQRLLSNLINNSVEAFDTTGTVSVSLSVLDGRVLIEVKDTGKGIPAVILAKLGQKGETHGKAGGNGLGLYHARTTIEGWGGGFKIESEPGKGTTVAIELPRAIAQKAFNRSAVLLDDDMLVHMNWKIAAKAAGVEMKAYKTPEDFTACIADLPKDTPIYIDSDLGNDVKGENIANRLHEKGFSNLTMATGHSPEKFAHLPWLKVTGKEPPWA